MKNVFSLTLLILVAILAIGCGNQGGGGGNLPDPPEPPEQPTIQQRYITLWGNNGDSGITVTQTPYEAANANYTSATREQVASFYGDLSDEVLFPLDAEYFYWTTSDLTKTLYVTKWADGTTTYSLAPFGAQDNYDSVTDLSDVVGPSEKISGFKNDGDDGFVTRMRHISPDLNRDDYEETPTGENGEFKTKSPTNSGQYL